MEKVDEKHIILTYEPMKEQDAFNVAHIWQILILELVEYFYPKLGDVTVKKYSKQVDKSASYYIEKHIVVIGFS